MRLRDSSHIVRFSTRLLFAALWWFAAASHAQLPSPATNVSIEAPLRVLTAGDKRVELLATGLPRQLTVNGHKLLSRPLQVLVDGKNVLGADDVTSSIALDGDQARFVANLEIDNAVRSKIVLRGSLEWDGLLTLELSAENIPPAYRPAEIRYSIALAEGAVRFLHRPGEVGKRNVDLQALASQTLPYVPFLWLGNDDFGMFWLSEQTRGWQNAQQSGAITLRRVNDAWVLECIIRPQFQVDGGWSHEFALAPTPVKPLPQRWREWRLSPARSRNVYVIWPNEIGSTYFGYPASNRQMTTGYLGRLRQGGVIGAPYLCPTWISTEAPEWQREGPDWETGVADRSFKSDLWRGGFVHVCTASQTWQSYAKAAFGDYIRANGLRAIYMDNAQVYRTSRCLSDADGPEYPMRGQRPVYQSIVTALRNKGSKTLAIVHSSGGVNAFSFSSVDALVSGEQYRGKVTSDYLDVATLTDFRVELNGAQWGLIPIFLPEFPETQLREVGPSRKLMTLLLLHDAGVWPLWVNVQEVDRALEQLDRFGVVDARFVPYYHPTPLARVQGSDILVSGYSLDQQTLLIAGNVQKTAAEGLLCPAHPPGPAARLRSWPERQPIPLRNGCATIRVEPGSYRMYHVAP
jgi:hypothetical protein